MQDDERQPKKTFENYLRGRGVLKNLRKKINLVTQERPIIDENRISLWKDIDDNELYINKSTVPDGAYYDYKIDGQGARKFRRAYIAIPINQPLTIPRFNQRIMELEQMYRNKVPQEIMTSKKWGTRVLGKRHGEVAYICKLCGFTVCRAINTILSNYCRISGLHHHYCPYCHCSFANLKILLADQGLDTINDRNYHYTREENIDKAFYEMRFDVEFQNCNCPDRRCRASILTYRHFLKLVRRGWLSMVQPDGTLVCANFKQSRKKTGNEIGRYGETYLIEHIRKFFKALGLNVFVIYAGEGGPADMLFAIAHRSGPNNRFTLRFLPIQVKTQFYTGKFHFDQPYPRDFVGIFLSFLHKFNDGEDKIVLENASICLIGDVIGRVSATEIRADRIPRRFRVTMDELCEELFRRYTKANHLYGYWDIIRPWPQCVNTMVEYICLKQVTCINLVGYCIFLTAEPYAVSKEDWYIYMFAKFVKEAEKKSGKFKCLGERVSTIDGKRYQLLRQDIQGKAFLDKNNVHMLRPQLYRNNLHGFQLFDRGNNTGYLVPFERMNIFLKQPGHDTIDWIKAAGKINQDGLEELKRYKYSMDEEVPRSLLARITGLPEDRFCKIKIEDVDLRIRYQPIQT